MEDIKHKKDKQREQKNKRSMKAERMTTNESETEI